MIEEADLRDFYNFTDKIYSLETVYDRVKFIEKYSSHAFQKYDPTDHQNAMARSNVRSTELRNRANVLYARKQHDDLFDALELYNKSICFAENDSEELSIAYANRSAVYFALRMYERCLENIDMAKSIGTYPSKLLPKLLYRESLCQNEIVSGLSATKSNLMSQYKYKPKLSHYPHSDVPFISELLQLEETASFGRSVVTTKEIKPGEVIAIENSYEFAVKSSHSYKRCANCLTENNLNLIPCSGCTSVMFCSVKCLQAAQKSVHGFECPLSGYVNSYLKSWSLPIRLTCRAFLSFNTVLDLAQFYEETKDFKSNVFAPLTRADVTPQQLWLHQVLSLEANEAQHTIEQLCEIYLATSIVSHLLMKQTRLSEICAGHESILIEFLYRFQLIVKSNSFSSRQFSCTQTEIYASGIIYPFSSLINHSCIQNVDQFTWNDEKLVLIAVRPIPKGEQIFINYG